LKKPDDAFQIAAMRSPLSDIEIQRDLGTLSGWARRGNALVKTYEFPTFADGIAFVSRVADAADALDHHPDIDIRYTKVTCHLSTHSAGGITKQDFKLAAAIEEAVE
jgi:4a-hydroxytetrahydrobiopterin dehydratase